MKGKFNKLEVVLRIKDSDGWVRSEWIVRDDRVELINYWPNGLIETQREVSMDEFYEAFQKFAPQASVPA